MLYGADDEDANATNISSRSRSVILYFIDYTMLHFSMQLRESIL